MAGVVACFTGIYGKLKSTLTEHIVTMGGVVQEGMARVYKVHGGPNFFPTIQIWTRISSLHIILIFASRPLNKGKNCIFIAFLR